MKNFIYIHICCINNWKEIFTNLMYNIKISGLYQFIDEIRCVILGDINDKVFKDSKIKIIYHSDDYKIYEFEIMKHIYNASLIEDFNILYIHTKGVKHFNMDTENNVKDWVDLLIYFNIHNYKLCIEKLNIHDVVGVNLIVGDEYPWHFSGNFWWSKSSHIKTLDVIQNKSYTGPEFYITSKKTGNYLSLWNSNTNHYNNRYGANNYVNKIKLLNVNNYVIQNIDS